MIFDLKKTTEDQDFVFFSISLFFISFVFLIFKTLFGSSETSDSAILLTILISSEILYLSLIKKFINFDLNKNYNFIAIFVLSCLSIFLWFNSELFIKDIIFFIFNSSLIIILFVYNHNKKKNIYDKNNLKYFFSLFCLYGFFYQINKENFIFIFSLNLFLAISFLWKKKDNFSIYLNYLFILIFFLIFFKVYLLSGAKDEFHYSWYLGPVNSILNGNNLLIDTVSQYGYLNILIIKLLSNILNINSELILVSLIIIFLLFFSYFLFINFSREVNVPSFLIMSSVVFLTFANLGYSGLNSSIFIPSSSVYRFFPAIIFFLLIGNYNFRGTNSLKLIFSISLSLFISLFWSFESFIFTFLTLTGSFVVCLILNYKEIKTFFSKKTIIFYFIYIILFVLLFADKETIFFYEYTFNFVNSTSAIPFSMNIYVLFFFSFLNFIYFIWRNGLSSSNLELNFKNTNWFILSIGFSSYFLIRSHPNNLFNILPFLIFCITQINGDEKSIKKFFLFSIILLSILVTSSSIFININDFKKKLLQAEVLELPKYPKIILSKDMENNIKRYPEIPVTIISGKTIHSPLPTINSNGFGIPTLPLEQFNLLKEQRKLEIYKKIFNDKPKHLILCIKDCHFYTSDEERKSWNDFFLPRHFLEKKIIFIDNNNMSLFLIERRYN